MAFGLLAGVAKGALANTAKGVAKDKAKNFITGKKKKVKPDSIKKKGGGEQVPGERGGALAVRPQTSMVPASVSTGAITSISGTEMASTKGGDNEEDIISVIRTKVIEIDKVLKGTLAQQKSASKKDRKFDEKQRRKKQEKILEKSTPKVKGSGRVKKLMAPAKGLFGGIFDFLKNILIGRLLVVLLEKKPNLPGGNLLMFIAGMAEKVIDMIIGVLDAVGGFLAFGQEKLDSARQFLVDNKGEEAGERFDGLLGALTNLFNAAVIVGGVFGALGLGPKGPGKKPTKPGPKKPTKPTAKPQTKPFGKGKPGMKPTGPSRAAKLVQKKHGHAARGIYEKAIENGKTPKQAKAAVDKALKKGKIVSKPQTGSLGGTDKGSKIAKGGLKKIPKRLATKVLGKQGIMAMKGIAKGFSRIPILGPIIVAVSSLLAGEPPGQALFKGMGAALGGFLGTFIPIPVIGTLLGETIGVLIGDMLYSLILGGGPAEAGQKFMNAIKTVLDVGGLIVKFVGDGFKNLINKFFETDPIKIEEGMGRRSAATKIVEILGLKDFLKDRGYVDGKDQVTKFPNLLNLFNPLTMIPMVAGAFFGDLFGGSSSSSSGAFSSASDSSDDESLQSGSGDSGGRERKPQTPQTVRNQGKASGNIRGKGNAIYLHWTAGNYNSTYGPYHTVFTGDGTMHRKTEYDQHVGHTYGRNSNSVGLSLASNPDINQWPTEAQKESMAKEAARIAKGWGWSASDINLNKVMTHGEAGSNLDGINAHSMYGLFGRGDSRVQSDKEARATGSVAAFERWDLDILQPGAMYGSGGDEMRERIRKFMSGGTDGKMSKGGLIRKQGRYELAEEGPEFVIDYDTYQPVEAMMPGLFDAINAAKGEDAVGILMSFAGYEEPASDELVMVGGSSGGSSYGETQSSMPDPVIPSSSEDSGSWKDIRYKFG